MFKGKKQIINPNTTDTLIGEGSVFEGLIKSEASIRIEGQIIGDIITKGDVTVGEKGIVRSNVTARDVIIAGKVYGNVSCQARLTIRPTGQLHGNTNAQTMIIDEGGIFQGTSKMESAGSTGAAPTVEAPAPSAAGGSAPKPAAAAAPFGGGSTAVL